jgi:hypothetical protein
VSRTAGTISLADRQAVAETERRRAQLREERERTQVDLVRARLGDRLERSLGSSSVVELPRIVRALETASTMTQLREINAVLPAGVSAARGVSALERFDLDELAGRIGTLEQLAATLGGPTRRLTDVRRGAEELDAGVEGGALPPALAAARYRWLLGAVQQLEAQLEDDLVAAERRHAILETVARELAGMGLEVTDHDIGPGATHIRAVRRRDQATANVEVTGDATEPTVTFVATAPRDAVDTSHPQAASACEPSELIADAIGRSVAAATGQEPVTARTSRRGLAARATGARGRSAARRRARPSGT